MAEPQKKQEEVGESLDQITITAKEAANASTSIFETPKTTEPTTIESFKFPDINQIAPDEETPPAVGAASISRSSSSGAFIIPALSKILAPSSADEVAQEQSIIDNDLIERKNTQSDALFNKVQSIPFDDKTSEQIATEINEIVAQEPKRRSVGTIYVDKKFPAIPPVQKQILADEIDIKLLYDQNVSNTANILGDEELSNIASKEFKFTVAIDGQLRKAIQSNSDKSPYIIAGSPAISSPHTVMAGLDESIVSKLDKLRPIYGDSVTALISFPNTIQHNFGSRYGPSEPAAENVELRSVQDALNFINIIGVEGGEEFEWRDMASLIVRGEFDAAGDDFARVAESKWGPNWGWRLAAFAAKEVGVDAALLALAAAIPAIGVPLLIGRRAGRGIGLAFKVGAFGRGARKLPLGPRLAAAIGRSVYVGVGGGAVQSGLNIATGRPSAFLEEAGLRVLGFGAAEALVKGISVAARPLRRAIRNTREQIAIEREVFKHKETLVKEANTVKANSPAGQKNLLTLIRLGHIFAEVNQSAELRRLAKDITDATSRKEGFEEFRSRLTKQLGVEDSQLDTLIPLAMEVFRNVAKVPALKAAQKTTQEATRELISVTKANKSLKAELKRIIAFHERHPLKPTAKNFNANTRKRAARIQDLKTALRESNKTLKQLKTAKAGGQATITELEKLGQIGSESQLADAIANSEAVGTRVLLGAHLESTRQQAINDLFTGHLIGLGRTTFRIPRLRDSSFWNSASFSPKRLLGDPIDVHALQSIPRQLLDNDNRTKVFNRLFLTMYRSAFHGLDSVEKRKVFDALDRGSEKGILWSIDDLMADGLNPKSIDAYYGVRKTLDFAHFNMDSILIKQFNNRNVKRLPDGRLAQILNTPVPKQFRSTGGEDKYVNYEVVSPVSSAPREGGTIKEASLRPIQSVLDLEQGYIPITYRDASYHVSEIDLVNGTHSRLVASTNRADAMAWMRKQQKLINESDAPDRILYVDKWNDLANKYTFTMARKGLDLIDTMDDRGVNSIKRAIDQAIKRNPNNAVRLDRIRIITDRLTGANLRKRFVGARAQRLEAPIGGEAPRLFTEEAIPDYLSAVAERSGLGEWRDWAIEQFLATYVREGAPRKVLPSHSRWFDSIPVEQPIFEISKAEGVMQADPRWVSEARAMQDWLKRIFSFKTSFEQRWDDGVDAFIARLEQRGQTGASKALDRFMPSITKVITGGRAVSGATKLLFFNVGQLIVQSSQIIPTLGSQFFVRPQILGPALTDVARAIGAIGRERAAAIAGKNPAEILSKQDSEILNAMRLSGWFEDISTSDIVTAASLDRPMFSRLRSQKNTLEASLQTAKGATGQTLRRIHNLGAAPFKTGEGTNRLVAFALVRREFIWKLENGVPVMNRITGKPFTKVDIDTEEFVREIVQKASVTALNMTRPGQLQLFSGLGSLVFQFKQVLPKSIRIVFAKEDLTIGERMGALAFYLGFWGPVGIPLLVDLATITDGLYWRFTGKEPDKVRFTRDWAKQHSIDMARYVVNSNPELAQFWGYDQKTIERLLQKGSINALTGGEIDLVNRVALGKFISEQVENMDPQDAIVFFSVIIDGYNALLKDGVQPSIWTTLEQYYEGQLTGFETFNKVLANTGRVISTAGYASRFIENIDKERFDPHNSEFLVEKGFKTRTIKSSSGRDTGVPIEGVGVIGKLRLWQYLFGLTPGPVVTELERIKVENEYRVAVRDYIRAQSGTYVRAHTSEARVKILAETIDQLEEAYPLIAGFDVRIPLTESPRWIYTQIFGQFWREWLKFSHAN